MKPPKGTAFWTDEERRRMMADLAGLRRRLQSKEPLTDEEIQHITWYLEQYEANHQEAWKLQDAGVIKLIHQAPPKPKKKP